MLELHRFKILINRHSLHTFYRYYVALFCLFSKILVIICTQFIYLYNTLYFLAYPVIVSLDAKIASRLNRNITVEVEYFSNLAGSNVKLYKFVNDAMKAVTLFSVTKNPVEIKVPVFSHLIKAKGTKAEFTVQIKSEEDYGFYYVVLSNIIGSSNKSFEIIPTSKSFIINKK
jgi:hypothetical protein